MEWEDEYRTPAQKLAGEGVDVQAVKARLKAQGTGTQLWGYADSSTRLGVLKEPCVPRKLHKNHSDAAPTNAMTGYA